jgi:hypothetical protein
MANTKAIEDTQERKKIKRAARKKAAPKGAQEGSTRPVEAQIG